MASPKKQEEFGILSDPVVDAKTAPSAGLGASSSTNSGATSFGLGSEELPQAGASKPSAQAAGDVGSPLAPRRIDKRSGDFPGFDTPPTKGGNPRSEGANEAAAQQPAAAEPRGPPPRRAQPAAAPATPSAAPTIGQHVGGRAVGAATPGLTPRSPSKEERPFETQHIDYDPDGGPGATPKGRGSMSYLVSSSRSPYSEGRPVSDNHVYFATTPMSERSDVAGQDTLLSAQEATTMVASFTTGIRHSGELYKLCGKTPLDVQWKKYWFYLVEDRLYYTADANRDTPVAPGGKVRFITLDRVPVRPLPHRRYRAIEPEMRSTLLAHRKTVKAMSPVKSPHRGASSSTSAAASPRRGAGASASSDSEKKKEPPPSFSLSPLVPDIGISMVDTRALAHLRVDFKPDTCFGLVSGSHTYFLAAETPEEARAWVEALRQAWLHCFKHTLRAGDAKDPVHETSRLMAQNASLRKTLKELETRGNGGAGVDDSEYWKHWLDEKSRNRALEEKLKDNAVYEVEVKTGKMKGSSTDARVYMEMFGPYDEVTTGELRLVNLDTHQQCFTRGALDLFIVTAKNVGLPKRIKVWHDNTGRHPDWFLEYIRIRKKSVGAWVVFPCMRWFSVRLDDSRITRLLYAGHASAPIQYKVITVTGDLRGAGTDANVHLVMHGTLGDGIRHVLTSGHDDFNRGATNEFIIDDEELGELIEVTVGHDGTGNGASWFLDHMLIINMKTNQKFIFPCRQWFDSRIGDGQIERVLPVAAGLGSMITYTFKISTSDVRGAGTDADVYVVLHGDGGDTPKTVLPSQPEHFERGQTDTFKMVLPYVGNVRTLTIGHNNKGPGPEWHLEMVEVIDDEHDAHYFFACNKWLAANLDDKQLERTLVARSDDPRGQYTDYRVDFHTSTLRGAGTDATVYFQLVGDAGESEVQRCVAPKEAFERGQVDTFSYRMRYLGRLRKMLVQHDNTGGNPAWHLFKVDVTCNKDKKTTTFVCNDWIKSEDLNVQPCVELLPDLPVPTLLSYRLEVSTSDMRGAGTDATVFVEIHGMQGKVGPEQLDRAGAFDRAQNDAFVVEGVDVGALTKLVVTTNGKGARPAWHLDHITVYRDASLAGNPDAAIYFPCRQWLDVEHGTTRELFPMRREMDKVKVPYTVRVFTSDLKGAGTDANVDVCVMGTRGDTGYQRLVSNHDTFERAQEDVFTLLLPDIGNPAFLLVRTDGSSKKPTWHLDFAVVECPDKWPAPVFFLGQTWLGPQTALEVKLPVTHNDPRGDRAEYRIWVHTSDVRFAGTDAGILLEILGDAGSSGRKPLVDMNKDVFERAQVDEFFVQCRNLGALRAIRIESDGKSAKPNWHMDMVVIQAPSGEKYYFPYSNWIGPQNPRVEIPATLMDPTTDRRVYKVVVHTSNIRSAGTDANVYVDLRGGRGSTGKTFLKNAKADCFERGESDEFEVRAASDLGSLVELVIGHDNSGQGPSWHLEQVDVIDVKTGHTWYFECNQWFDLQQGDGKIERVLAPSLQNPRTQRTVYMVNVKTSSEVPNAGTDAKVYVNLFGTLGQSGVMWLKNANPDNFEGGQTDEFQLPCRSLGDLTKLVIGHDNSGLNPDWHLEIVSVTDLATKVTYWFPFNKWFDKSKEDGLIEREQEALLTPPVLKRNIDYIVRVKTSDISGAGTDANVFIQLFGKDGGDSGRIKLDTMGNDFERNQMDEFKISAKEMDPFDHIRIGHDNSGLGAAWHLDHVEVINSSNGKKYMFKCGKWFSKKHGDFQIERNLREGDQPPHQYNITVHTSDISGAGTDSNVFVILYGTKGETGALLLDNPKNNFERNQTDVFQVEGEDVGQVTRCKIWTDLKGLGAAWHMDFMTVASSNQPGVLYWFYCGAWLDKEQPERHLKAFLSDPRNSLVNYKVTTHTSDVKGAGTDANVYVNLFSKDCDSGALKLDGPGNKFESGAADTFNFKMVDLGDLTELEVWHDNGGLGPGWHLDYIEVHSSANQKVYYFPCGQWLDKKEGDGQIKRRLVATLKDPRTFKSSYRVTTMTSDISGAGTDANVFINIYGPEGETGRTTLDNPMKNDFERGQVDVFEFEAKSIGAPISKILIGHDGKGLGSGWHLNKVIVENLTTGESVTFEANRWLDKAEGDGKIEIELTPSSSIVGGINWKLTVVTGTETGAGTDADVFTELRGDKGSFGPHLLAAQKGAFETGCRDVFSLTTPDIGVPNELCMGHNNKGIGAAWYLESCELEKMDTGEKWFFDFKCWLDQKRGLRAARPPVRYTGQTRSKDGKANYRIELTTGPNPDSMLEKGEVSVDIRGSNGATGRQPLEMPPQGFQPSRCEIYALPSLMDTGSIKQLEIGHTGPEPWFVKEVSVLNETTGAQATFVVDRLLHPNEYVVIDVAALAPTDYAVEVVTTDRRNAGTSANCSITLYGINGSTGRQALRHPDEAARDEATGTLPTFCRTSDVCAPRSAAFSRGGRDTFVLKQLPDVGRMQQLEVGHDNSGMQPGWHLAYIRVTNVNTGASALFPCDQWLAKGEGDKKIVRLLDAQEVTTPPPPTATATVTVGPPQQMSPHMTPQPQLTPPGGMTPQQQSQQQMAPMFYSPQLLRKLGGMSLGQPGYRITFNTSNICMAGTNAPVFFELIGENGSSGTVTARANVGDFSRGSTVTYVYPRLPYLGEILQFRVGTTGAGMFATWHLRNVDVVHISTGDRWQFSCHNWVDKKTNWQRVLTAQRVQ